MLRTAAIAALLSLTAGSALAQAAARVHVAPPASFQGQWFTTADGCSYSRAQAPGYAPTWHLIINPHHIGQPAAHRGCPAMLTSRG
ncbi:hypothetical protein [Wenxinia marina]|uniref:Uncharacterized protein n=1 Tax=Wenxinia marina DSM 24838 TaxID=1123501 RepID=A0A0D0QEM4_9RHOB|nr:hypothetical protein [Wenxinia marina]KIQ70787.1 hypothetical protein Wenmar_00161 [Wenxinia marina DSM 24838]GGL57298.1 hypothetical protein GCM10011392_09710 [Wenxinia marina]